MLDYRPNIIEINKNKITGVDESNILKSNDRNNDIVLDNFYRNLEFFSTSNAIAKTNNLKDIKINSDNPFINKAESNNFDDVLNYESQNDRLISVSNELKELEETLSIMMYGEVVSYDVAMEKDKILFENLKTTNKVNSNNLINLSKMLIIINEYINSVEKHIEGISYINMEISDFSKQDKEIVLTDEEINSIQSLDKENLENSLYTSNYISDKSVINNHMIKLYNSIVDYNLCCKAINKLNTDNNIDKSLIYKKETEIKTDFISFIKTVEYSTIQSEEYLKSLRVRFDNIKDLYIYEKGEE